MMSDVRAVTLAVFTLFVVSACGNNPGPPAGTPTPISTSTVAQA